MHNFFEGYYFKLTNSEETLCFIVGYAVGADAHSFIQVLGSKLPKVYYFRYEILMCTMMRQPLYIRINNNIFTSKRINVDLEQEDFSIKGTAYFVESVQLISSLYTPTIMGPLHYLQPNCVHELVTIYSRAKGDFLVNGERKLSYNHGFGYIEGDRGRGFPKAYLWLQAMEEQFSIFLAHALVPWQNRDCKGTICVIHTARKQFRFASYYLVRVRMKQDNSHVYLELCQGALRLLLTISYTDDFIELPSPKEGTMSEHTQENLNAHLSLVLYKEGQKILVKRDLLCTFELLNSALLV